MIVANGCSVHAVWASPQQERVWDIYVSTIDLNDCAPADTNASGAVESADAPTFLAAFSASDSLADRNRDKVVDAADFASFIQAFGNPPPP